MAHTFAGTPDARQSDNPDLSTSRFRPRYRALTDNEKALHDAIKAKADELLSLYAMIGPVRSETHRPEPMQELHIPSSASSSRYLALGVTDLESSIMWAVKALTV